MSITNLLSKGSSDAGKLEKFADGCNAAARSLWLGERSVNVKLIKDESGYTLKAIKNEESGTSKCMAVAEGAMNIYPIGILFSLIIVLGYALTCIPVALAMGVGLATKKIALATDENSKRYHVISQKYLSFLDKKIASNQLHNQLNSKRTLLETSSTKLSELEKVEISGDPENSYMQQLRKSTEDQKVRIISYIEKVESEIQSLEEEIKLIDDNLTQSGNELNDLFEEYLRKKNGKPGTLNMSDCYFVKA